MKRFLIICFTAFTFQSTAQDILPFTFGPLVSMTSTSLESNAGFKDQVAGTGYNLGVFFRFKIVLLYAECELSYAGKSISTTLNDNTNVVYDLNGTDGSLIAGMKLLPMGDIGNLRIFAGYNWNNYSAVTYSVNGQTFEAGNVNKNNHGLLAGLGCDVWHLAFNLKYVIGMSDLATAPEVSAQTRVVNITLEYMFR